ncbi:hypothetical protein niasHT_032557 [Heterodera trifolii]|uniref:Uncharacterized protein n=1 Tax=Heterodera trifolii TaxID=157864 RepID=A0ABD2J7H9_9BILA
MVNLSAIYLNKNLMSKDVQQNVQNGDKLDIPMPTNVREFDEFKLVFRIFVKPLDSEYQSGGFDEDLSDDQPFEDQFYQLQMDDIRSMVRPVGFVLYEPNFAKRYTFNLGQIDPPGLFWKRRIFLDAKNGGPDNLHGFLHATVNKNQRNLPMLDEKILLGHAPLTAAEIHENELTTNTEQSRSNHLHGEASTSQQQHIFHKHCIVNW